jgi:hypothetical protein
MGTYLQQLPDCVLQLGRLSNKRAHAEDERVERQQGAIVHDLHVRVGELRGDETRDDVLVPANPKIMT